MGCLLFLPAMLPQLMPMKRITCLLQMTKGKVGSLLVFNPEKISFEDQSAIKSATSDAVVGIVTERGGLARLPIHQHSCQGKAGHAWLGASGHVSNAYLWLVYNRHGTLPNAIVKPSWLCPAASRKPV